MTVNKTSKPSGLLKMFFCSVEVADLKCYIISSYSMQRMFWIILIPHWNKTS